MKGLKEGGCKKLEKKQKQAAVTWKFKEMHFSIRFCTTSFFHPTLEIYAFTFTKISPYIAMHIRLKFLKFTSISKSWKSTLGNAGSH